MAEFISKLSSSATQWFYKSATGFEDSTQFGTGSGDTHTFSGSVYVSGSQAIENTGDVSWLPGGASPADMAAFASADRFIVGEHFYYIASGSITISSTDLSSSGDPSLFLNRSLSIPITISGDTKFTDQVYFQNNFYNSVSLNASTPITASSGTSFLAVSSSGPTSILLPPAETGLELTIADVSGSAGANTITINASGSNKIQSASSLEITSNYGTVTFFAYDSTNWHVKSTN